MVQKVKDHRFDFSIRASIQTFVRVHKLKLQKNAVIEEHNYPSQESTATITY